MTTGRTHAVKQKDGLLQQIDSLKQFETSNLRNVFKLPWFHRQPEYELP